MRTRLIRRGILPALLLVLWATPAGAAIGDALGSIPAADPFPAGLAFRGQELWLADWETGELHRLNRDTGEIVQTVPAPCFHPEGLASDGKVLFISDTETARIYVFDPDRGVTLVSYEAPEKSPKGLAFGGGSLWLVDDGTDQIYEIVPSDGTILNYYKAPYRSCVGLAHDGTHLWVTDRRKDELYAVRPSDGEVLFLVKTPGPYPAGLAFGDGELWLGDFQTKRVYRLRHEADSPYRVTNEVVRDFRFRHFLRNDADGPITEASIYVACPYDSLPNQKILGPVQWRPQPDKFVRDRWNQRVAVYRFRDVPPHGEVEGGYSTRLRLGEIHYAFYPEDVGGLEQIPSRIRKTYTAPTSRLQLDKKLVRDTAAQIVGDEDNAYWIARRIFDWVREKLEYKRVGGWDVPTTLIKRGTGSCSEYAFLYIALCRAAGLPARYEASVVVRGDDASMDDVYHRWCQVFLPGIGWMPVDPSGGDQEWPADQARYFGGLANRFIITTHGGGDSKELGWDYNAHATWTVRGKGVVHEEGYGVWSPVSEPEAK